MASGKSVRRGEPQFSRSAVAPALLAAIVLFATFAIIDTSAYLYVRFAVTILTAIVAYYAVRAAKFWWLVGLVPIILFFNPVYPITTWPFEFAPMLVLWITLVAPIFLMACGVFLKVPVDESSTPRR